MTFRIVLSSLAERFVTSLEKAEWADCYRTMIEELAHQATADDGSDYPAGFPYRDGVAARTFGKWVFYYSVRVDASILDVSHIYYAPTNPKHPQHRRLREP